jgi:hypothetical protein
MGGSEQTRRVIVVVALLSLPALPALPALHAQHAAFRVKGRVVGERGDAIANAAVRAEAFYGYAAGTFSGQRIFTAQSNAKGEWSIGAMQPGIWQFDVVAPGRLAETWARRACRSCGTSS